MTGIVELCKQHDLLLLEDCSHAHFASWKGQRVGTFGTMAAFSLNQKGITSGEGGVLITNSVELRDRALLCGDYGHRCRRFISPKSPYRGIVTTGVGLKQRPHPVAMAIALHQLHQAATIRDRRLQNVLKLTAATDESEFLEPLVIEKSDGELGLYVFPMRMRIGASVSREELVAVLHAEGATEFDVPNSTRLIHGEPLFRSQPSRRWAVGPPDSEPPTEEFREASVFASRFVKLPLWGYPGDAEIVDRYCDALRKVGHHRRTLARGGAAST
jgi:dTDP-4-amino-4,6-dideoxygalactose transaminase